jgi:cytochrome c553
MNRMASCAKINQGMNRLIHFLFSLPMTLAAVDYAKDIKPLLKERCVSCHGTVKQKGGLRLDAGALIGKSIHADLLERVTSHDEDERMPPEGARLTESQVEALRKWFAAGAPFPSDEVIPKKPSEHWSFQPVKRRSRRKSIRLMLLSSENTSQHHRLRRQRCFAAFTSISRACHPRSQSRMPSHIIPLLPISPMRP